MKAPILRIGYRNNKFVYNPFRWDFHCSVSGSSSGYSSISFCKCWSALFGTRSKCESWSRDRLSAYSYSWCRTTEE